KEGWHGKALNAEQATQAIEELGGERHLIITPPKPEAAAPDDGGAAEVTLPTYDADQATRKAFGEALAALAVRPDVVALDGEVANSTHFEDFQKAAPDRFFEMYIGEQNMLGAAVGMQALGKTAFAGTFGAFLTRGYDFVRMAAISRANLRLCGSHAGVSIGEDGPSQMALEDLSMMRSIHGSTVLYPADANAAAKLVEVMAETPGISYMRTTREKTPKLYGPDEEFTVGGSKVVKSGDDDQVTIVSAGVTLFEGLKAADQLAREGVKVRVIDAYSIKPIDAGTVRRALDETGLLVVVEDHWSEGGLGDAVLDALAEDGAPLSGRVVKIAVTEMAGSGTAEELRDWAGISAAKIAERIRTVRASE
ncbi:MAG TPA: transketolase, partial [Actinobacteria bacterium]|nr:transketolase [Actinomycetota bacterium]